MLGDDRGLQNVYVYLRSRSAPIHEDLQASAAERVVLDNRDCIFIPHCLKIWCPQQEFYIVNSDPVPQNVAYAPFGDEHANVVIPVGGDVTWRFKVPQRVPIPIACNYHPWERAYILPLDHPYAAISAADGTFHVANLPTGQWEFQLWQERVGYLHLPEWPRGRRTLEIQAGTNDLGTITISPTLFET
jgi:hypothetical protein